MSKLYELSEQYRKMMEMVDDALDNSELDEDDLQMFIDTIESLEDSISQKCENIVKFMKNLEGDINAFKAEEKRLSTRRKYMENKVEGLKNYMSDMLKNAKLDNVSAGNFTVKFQKSPASVSILDESKIPAEFRESQPDKILKSDLREALMDKKTIEGVVLVETNRHLRIV